MDPRVSRAAVLLLGTALVPTLALALAVPGAARADGGAPARAAARAATGVPVVVETYNILGSDHPKAGQRIGGDLPDRTRRAARVITGGGGGPAADIVGLQEVTVKQRALFDQDLPDYQAVPTNGAKPGNSIYFRTAAFTLEQEGSFAYPYYADRDVHDGHGKGRWALLSSTTDGHLLFVVNVHAVSFNRQPGSDRGGALKRQVTAKAVASLVARAHRAQPTVPIVVTGDWNSTNNVRADYPGGAHDASIAGQRYRLPYCTLTRDPTLLQDSRDLLHDDRGHCPDTSHTALRDNTIDWIYASPSTWITSWRKIDSPATQHASDHDPVQVGIDLG